MMEAMILLLCQQMPVSAAARHLGETDKRIWRVLDNYVMEALSAKDWSGLCHLSAGKREKSASLVCRTARFSIA